MQLRVINVVYLGRVDYATALDLQQTVVHLVKAARIGHTLLLLEHPPVVTLGRNADVRNIGWNGSIRGRGVSERLEEIMVNEVGDTTLNASREFLAGQGVELFETDRGGDVTFHGPGQLVGYPIFDLRAFVPRMGAVDFVRKIEEALIRICGDLGVVTGRITGMTGVWTEQEPPAKVAAIGVHISRAVSSHGFALNVSTNLDYFKLIVPCGLAGKPVTSLEVEMAGLDSPRPVPSLEETAQMVSRSFGRVFEAQTLWLDSLDALVISAPSGPANEDTPVRAPEAIRKLAGEEDIHLA